MGVPCVGLGVDRFGQFGTVADLQEEHDLTSGSPPRIARSRH